MNRPATAGENIRRERIRNLQKQLKKVTEERDEARQRLSEVLDVLIRHEPSHLPMYAVSSELIREGNLKKDE